MVRPLLESYCCLTGPDEMFAPDGSIRSSYADFARRLGVWEPGAYQQRQELADLELLNSGITFTVYQDDAGTERIFPFSLIPRIIPIQEWRHVEAGIIQRVTVLNRFLHDVYNEQECLQDEVVPTDLICTNPEFNLRMIGFTPPLGVYTHIAGCDLIRDVNGEFRVLEDNLRTPSGVSYVIENRRTMLNIAPDLFPADGVAPIGDYPERLIEVLIDVRPDGVAPDETKPVILTPGSFNSAYFEHSFLARQMGIELVEGRDLIVHDQVVYLRATTGLERVHVIYRRIDDAFLDPLSFNSESVLGVSGLADAYRAGNVTIVNAMGTGIADDKVLYRFVPDLIRYYTGEEPILPNVDTYVGILASERRYILDNIGDLVLKPAGGSGGFGIVVGPQASASELEAAREHVKNSPRDWIAQPLQEFSTIPSFNGECLEPRRADLRPYAVTGSSTYVIPGGLTRVARDSSSYIVNSSQGGGSKDTWIVGEPWQRDDATSDAAHEQGAS